MENRFRLDFKRCPHAGFHYCSDCEEEFSYPAKEIKHAGHHYYETLQASLHYKKCTMLKEAKATAKELYRYEPEKEVAILKTSLAKCDDDVKKYIKHHSSHPQYFRIASWNLCKLSGKDKCNELFKKRLECICKTILYYQVDVIALQELFNCENIKKIMIHTLRYYSHLEWEMVEEKHEESGEHLFILFHKELIQSVKKLPVLSVPKIMCCEMTLINGTLQKIFNTHITYTDKEKKRKELDDLIAVNPPIDTEPTNMYLGDFNASRKTISKSMGEQHHCIFDEETNTLLTKSYDNIVIPAGKKEMVHNHFVGSIITCDELAEGKVSDHRPIIADLDIPDLGLI